MLYLLRRTAHAPLTYSRVAKLFPPKFSEMRSNRRLKEEAAFRLFFNYLKEVAGTVCCRILLYYFQMRSKQSPANIFNLSLFVISASRREPITLGAVLNFVTCSEEIPVLGFAIDPLVCFSNSMQSCLPKSNACINQLMLAIGEVVPDSVEELFAKFDMDFCSKHLGLV